MTDGASRRPFVSPKLALSVALVAVSTAAIFIRLADAPPIVIAFSRCAISSMVMLPFAFRGLARDFRNVRPRALMTAGLAGVFLAAHFLAWITSLQYASVASSVVLVSTVPIWVGLMTPILSHDSISRLMVIGIAISSVGAAVIGIGDASGSEHALMGDAIAVLGAIAVSVYLLIGRRVRSELSAPSYLFLCYSAAAATLGILLLFSGESLHGHPNEAWLWILCLALIPQMIGHSTFNWALEWVSAALISVVLLCEPILTTLFAWIVLAEAPTASTVGGGVLVMIGVYVAVRGEESSKEHDQIESDASASA